MAVFNANPTSQVTVTIPVPSAVAPSQPAQQPAPAPTYQPSQQVASSLPPEEPPHQESSYTVILPHSGAGLVKPKQPLSRAGSVRRYAAEDPEATKRLLDEGSHNTDNPEPYAALANSLEESGKEHHALVIRSHKPVIGRFGQSKQSKALFLQSGSAAKAFPEWTAAIFYHQPTKKYSVDIGRSHTGGATLFKNAFRGREKAIALFRKLIEEGAVPHNYTENRQPWIEQFPELKDLIKTPEPDRLQRRGPKPVVKFRRVSVPLRRYAALDPSIHRNIAQAAYDAYNNIGFGVPATKPKRIERFVNAHNQLINFLEESGHQAAADFTRRYIEGSLADKPYAYHFGLSSVSEYPLYYTKYGNELVMHHQIGPEHQMLHVVKLPENEQAEFIRRFDEEGIPNRNRSKRMSRSRHYAAATPESVRSFILSGMPREEMKAALSNHFDEHGMPHLAEAMRQGDANDWLKTGRLGQQTPVSYENFQHPLIVQIKKYKVGDPKNNRAPYSVQIMPEAYHMDRGFVKPAFIFYGTHDKNHIAGLIDELTRFHGGGGFTTPGEPGYEWATSKWFPADSPENIKLGLHHLLGEEA